MNNNNLSGFRYRIAKSTIDYRWIWVMVTLLLTIFFAVGAMKVELRTIFSDLLPKDHPFVQTYQDHPNFGSPLTITVMVKNKNGDIYNPDTLAKVWRLTREIDLTPGIDHDSILSIASEKARYSESTPFGIDSRPLMGDTVPKTQAEVQELIKRVEKSANVRSFLISGDQSATLITATLIERLAEYDVAFDFIQTMIESEQDDAHEIYVAGAPILTGWVYTYQVQMLGIFAITALALLASLVVYTRNITGILTPFIVSVVSAIWGFGFVGWIGDPIEPLIMVVPLMLVARAFSHCVQFVERYYELYARLNDKKKAAEEALRVMMAPGALGIFTDAMGLFLIALAPIPVMERFALFCGFWAMILIPTNLYLTPIMLSFLPAPRSSAESGKVDGNTSGKRGISARILKGIASLVVGKRLRFTAVALVLLSVYALANIPNLKIGNSVEGSNILWPESDYNTSVRAINSHFPGLMTLEIIFEQKSDGRILKEADTYAAMVRLQRILEKQEQPPEASLSFADYLPEAHRLFSGGNPKWAPIEITDDGVNAAARALLLGASTKSYSNVADFELTNGTVSLWYKDNKQETVDLALSQARQAIAEIGAEQDNFRIRLGTGAIALQQSVNDTVDQYQWHILLALNVVILFTCSLAYRSIMAGILLLIPVNLSNFLLGLVMIHMDIGLDVNTLPIAAIGVGVGIDYGIYLLSRICEEYGKFEDFETAISTAIQTTGKAIFFTASIVLMGILPWYFLSGLKFLADMGVLLVMVMLINMLIALTVVPILVNIIRPKFVSKQQALMSHASFSDNAANEKNAEKEFSTDADAVAAEKCSA